MRSEPGSPREEEFPRHERVGGLLGSVREEFPHRPGRQVGAFRSREGRGNIDPEGSGTNARLFPPYKKKSRSMSLVRASAMRCSVMRERSIPPGGQAPQARHSAPRQEEGSPKGGSLLDSMNEARKDTSTGRFKKENALSFSLGISISSIMACAASKAPLEGNRDARIRARRGLPGYGNPGSIPSAKTWFKAYSG